MTRWIAPDRLFNGTQILRGQALCLTDGVITDIGPAPRGALRLKGLVTPGFVDLQVNGGGGVMLNTTPTRAGIATIAKAHRAAGTVALLPTVITDRPEVLAQAAEAVLAARDLPGVIGLHIEGPHISLTRRGTHAAAYVRPFDDTTLRIVTRLRDADMPVMITLAPEAATPDQISALARTGAVVSIGHSDATAETTRAALTAGARCFTHLFNAMSPMTSRAPGVVGAAINSDACAGIICDGAHVADEMVGLAIRARPVADRMFLVSDAMATVGGPPSFDLYGQRITLRDGRLVNKEGSLAGAHVTQAIGVKRLVTHTGTDLETALRMATSTPATLMGLPDLGQMIGRRAADVLLLDDDLEVAGSLGELLATAVASDA